MSFLDDLLRASPTGPAGGDLGGHYPNPTVAALRMATGLQLVIGTIGDGQVLTRAGTTIVGTDPGSGGPGGGELADDLTIHQTSFTAVLNTAHMIDALTSGEGGPVTITVTLPAAPAHGDQVELRGVNHGLVQIQVQSSGGHGVTYPMGAIGVGLPFLFAASGFYLKLRYTTGAGNNSWQAIAYSPSVLAGSDAPAPGVMVADSGGNVYLATGADVYTALGDAGGDVSGPYDALHVDALHSAGTQLTVGAISAGQMVVRSGTQLIGAAVPSALPPNGAASGDLGGSYPSPTVGAIHSGATQLAVGTIADGEFLKRVGSTIVSAVASGGTTFTPADLSPRHWWKASAVVGSPVDTITDAGSGAKNFTAAGALRVSVATDANGKAYLNFTGAGMYTAGVAADWTWLHDGTKPYTLFLVAKKATGLWTSGIDGIINTNDWSSTQASMSCSRGGSGGGGGFEWGINNTGTNKVYLTDSRIMVNHTGIHAYAWAFLGANAITQFSAYSTSPETKDVPIGAEAWRFGTCVMRCPSNGGGYTATATANTLALGAFANGANKATLQIYDVMLVQRACTPYEIHQWNAWAQAAYSFSPAA